MRNLYQVYKRLDRCILYLLLGILLPCGVMHRLPGQICQAGEPATSLPHGFLCAEPSFKLTPKQSAISLLAREIAAANAGYQGPRQRTRDLDALYQEAARADQYLKRITCGVANRTGGTPVFPPGEGLKRRKRATEKIEVELGGDPSLLMDISRSSIEYERVEQVYDALQYILRQGYEVVRVKDRAIEPLPSGFWDIHLNLRAPNGHIVEMQLHIRKIRQYSTGFGHSLYERIRDMESRAFREGRPLTSRERQIIDRLNCRQRRFYEAAFREGQKTRE